MALPTDPKERKNVPIASGVLDYFPDAIAAVAALSRAGNEQHNPGKPLFWDRDKSGDEADALMRHFMERGTIDTDGIRHSAKVAWRALALLQKELEEAYGLPLPRGARQSAPDAEKATFDVDSWVDSFKDPQGSLREIFQRETARTEAPNEDYIYSRGGSIQGIKASFPPFQNEDSALARMARMERGEVVGIPAERAQSQGQPLAPEVRSVERIKETVFGTKQAPEV